MSGGKNAQKKQQRQRGKLEELRRELDELERQRFDTQNQIIPSADQYYLRRLQEVRTSWASHVCQLIDHSGSPHVISKFIDDIQKIVGGEYADYLLDVLFEAIKRRAYDLANSLEPTANEERFVEDIREKAGEWYAHLAAVLFREKMERLTRQRKPLDAARV